MIPGCNPKPVPNPSVDRLPLAAFLAEFKFKRRVVGLAIHDRFNSNLRLGFVNLLRLDHELDVPYAYRFGNFSMPLGISNFLGELWTLMLKHEMFNNQVVK